MANGKPTKIKRPGVGVRLDPINDATQNAHAADAAAEAAEEAAAAAVAAAAEAAAAELRAQYDALNNEGFPDELIEAFLHTAAATASVISTRTPGRAGRTLIKEHHDLKSFSIKSKSCDWGPMEGFICTNPYFNKKGAKGAAFNIAMMKHYYAELAVTPESLASQNPSVPLQISDDRKVEVAAKLSFCGIQRRNCSVGVAFSADESVAMQFILKKDPDTDTNPFWKLYYRAVYKQTAPSGPYERVPVDPKWWGEPEADVIEATETTALDTFTGTTFAAENKTLAGGAADKLAKTSAYPIRGLMNANPPYLYYQRVLEGQVTALTEAEKTAIRAGNAVGLDLSKDWKKDSDIPAERRKALLRDATAVPLHKDAVSGDFDLFAVWPHIADGLRNTLTRDELIRRTDDAKAGRWSQKPEPGPLPLFRVVRGRTYAVEAIGFPNLFIEMVPGFGEIAPIEDKETGNINEAVAVAAGELNDWVQTTFIKEMTAAGLGGVFPNSAFHSDECGRPGVFEVEFPVAVFLPCEVDDLGRIHLIGKVADPARKIADLSRLLEIVRALQGQCFINLHYGWLRQLFAAPPRLGDPPGAPGIPDQLLGEFFLGPKNGKPFRDAANDGDTTKAASDADLKRAAIEVGKRLRQLFQKYNEATGTPADVVAAAGMTPKDVEDLDPLPGDMTLVVKEFLAFRSRPN